MKIAVIAGSPKGEQSITMQYVHYLGKHNPDHDWQIIQVAQPIKKLEKDRAAFAKVIDEIKEAQLVLWAFPLYYLTVPYGYKRFIELLFERGVAEHFSGKFAAILTTSIHFYDHTAHNYMHAVSDDLQMKFVGGISLEMYDLMKTAGRQTVLGFGKSILEAVRLDESWPREYTPIKESSFSYQPGSAGSKIDPGSRKVLILTDAVDENSNQAKMVRRLGGLFAGRAETINIRELKIKGGCTGCIQCGYENVCLYDGKDDFNEFYRTKVLNADLVFFCGEILDRYLSSRWKLYFDRSFFMNHTPALAGRQIAWIISGPLGQNANLRQIMEAYIDNQDASLAGIVTDESGDSAMIDKKLDELADRVIRYAELDYVRPKTFLGVGGRKIFRDDIWGRLRFPFIADHKYYKEHGVYDFPQTRWKQRALTTLMVTLAKVPPLRKMIYKKMIKPEMIKPLQAVVKSNK